VQNVELLNVKLAVHIVTIGLERLIYISLKFSPYRAVNTISVVKTSQSMLYKEIVAVCS